MITDAPKRRRDQNQLAKLIVDLATGEASEADVPEKAEGQQRGGLKGGVARAKALTPAERSEIARLTASARWKKGG